MRFCLPLMLYGRGPAAGIEGGGGRERTALLPLSRQGDGQGKGTLATVASLDIG